MIGIASMGLGIIQNLPSMPLDDQWETIQNWEERHDALETHLERIVSKFSSEKMYFYEKNGIFFYFLRPFFLDLICNKLKRWSSEKINSTGS